MSTIRTSTTSTRAAPAPWADRIGRGLMVLDALATLVAFAGGIVVVTTAVAYVLCRAWHGWRDVHVRTAQTSDHHPTHTGCAP